MAVEISDAVKSWLVDNGFIVSQWLDKETDPSYETIWRGALAKAIATGKLSNDKFLQLSREKTERKNMASMTTQQKAAKMFGSGDNINVKPASGKFSDKRYEVSHPKYGDSVRQPNGQRLYEPSERDNAMAGAFYKYTAKRAGFAVDMAEWERDLLDEMCHDMPWCGRMGGVEYDAIPGGAHIKALLDDSTSGGQEIVPIWYDTQIVTTPLLTGEVLPLVTIVDVPRGRQVNSASMGHVTISSGQGDNTTVDLFSTASMVAELNTDIFGAAVSVELGKDFLSDSVVNVGQYLTSSVSEKLAEWLDNQIVNGDGTTEPSGIDGTSGFSSVSADVGGSWGFADVTELSFAIGKAYRVPTSTCSFLSNDTTFARLRAIATGVTDDDRPIFAPVNELHNYQTLGFRHAVQNDLGNAKLYFGNFRRGYRLYRRSGLEIQWATNTEGLLRKNCVVMVARARYGGRVMDTGCFVKITDGQA